MLGEVLLARVHWTHHGYEFCNMTNAVATLQALADAESKWFKVSL